MHTLEAPLQYVINLTRSNLQKMEASGRVTKKKLQKRDGCFGYVTSNIYIN